MKKTILLGQSLLFAFSLLAQNTAWEKYGLETVLALSEPPHMEEDFYVVDSLYCHQFDSTLTEQPVSRKYNLDFTSEGAVLESISQIYLPDVEEWQNDVHEFFTYDVGGNVFDQVTQLWDAPSQNWINDRRDVNTWNAAGKLDLVLKQEWSIAANTWQNTERLTFEYDADGIISSFQQELWDMDAFEWERKFRILYIPDSEGQIVSTIFQFWLDNDFKSLNRTFSTFENGLETETVTEVWNDAEEIWVNSNRRLKEYDSNENLTNETNQIWLVQDTTWENQSLILRNFNVDGDITLLTQLIWGGDNWVNFFQTENSFDANGNLARFEVAQWQITEWVPVSSCDFYWRFHHEIMSNVETAELECAIPNPFKIGTSFQCGDLPSGKNVSLQIYDLSGKKVYEEKTGGAKPAHISGPLKEGLYVLLIRDGSEVLLAQKIYLLE